MNQPLISIVTPSYNQGQYLGETLQSLVDQNYPALEVVIQDGGSTDQSVAVAQEFVQKYPGIFQLHCEKDKGQAHALNLGFAKTRGSILGFLNSDDTLYPGCLHSVAREIDPARGRHVVFGRCLFTGEGSPYVGVEHPAEWLSHFEHLAIWKRGFNTLPQPSVFWHREVWERCGGLNEQEGHVLDYDLFCRFSARYPFHRIDELWSTYRMHPVSKSAQKTEPEVLALSIAVSRRHWGPWWSPLRWRLEASHRRYARQNLERARHHARMAEQAWAEKRRGRAALHFLRTATVSPRLAWQRLLQPLAAGIGLDGLERLVWQAGPSAEGEFTGRHADGWVGPLYRDPLALPAGTARLILHLIHHPQPGGQHQRIECELQLDGRVVASQAAETGGAFQLDVPVADLAGRTVPLELRTKPYFVPATLGDSPDTRKLAVVIAGTEMVPAARS